MIVDIKIDGIAALASRTRALTRIRDAAAKREANGAAEPTPKLTHQTTQRNQAVRGN